MVTLPQHFMRNGYHAAAIGKIYHNVIPDSLSWSEPKLHIDGYPFDPDAVYRHPDNIAIQEARKAEIIEAGEEARYIDQYGQWYLKAASTEAVSGDGRPVLRRRADRRGDREAGRAGRG